MRAPDVTAWARAIGCAVAAGAIVSAPSPARAHELPSTDAPPGSPSVPPERTAELTLSPEALRFQGSDFDRTLRIFDHAGMNYGLGFVARGLYEALPWLRVGARIGYVHASSDPAALDNDIHLPGTDLAFDLYDFGGVVRFVHLAKGGRGGVRADFSVEGGVVIGSESNFYASKRITTARVGASGFIGYEGRAPGAVIGFRLGYDYVPWNGAGGSSYDPAFAAFFGALEGGVTL